MKNQQDVQRKQLLLDAVRVVLHAKFTTSHGRGPALSFNDETNPVRALRLAREHLQDAGISESKVIWDGTLLSSLLENGINHIDVMVPRQTQVTVAQSFAKTYGRPTTRVPQPDIRIVVSGAYCVPGQFTNGRVQLPHNCDRTY